MCNYQDKGEEFYKTYLKQVKKFYQAFKASDLKAIGSSVTSLNQIKKNAMVNTINFAYNSCYSWYYELIISQILILISVWAPRQITFRIQPNPDVKNISLRIFDDNSQMQTLCKKYIKRF